MNEYKIKISDEIKIPKDIKKYIVWAITDICNCSEQFVEVVEGY